MSQTATYHTTVNWTGEHHGRLVMGNGPELDFSAPPEAHGLAGVFTPEDAFVAAANTCIMLMFIWAVERFKLNLISYECRALQAAQKYILVANSIKSQISVEPEIEIALA